MKLCNGYKWNKRLYAAVLTSAAALLAACALPAVAPLVADEVQIKIVGVLTVKSGDQPVRRLRLTWERVFYNAGVRDIVEVKSPLGNTQGRLQSDAGGVTVVVAGREPAESSPLGNLLRKLPPPKSMGYWLLGASDPDYSTRELFVPGSVGVRQIIQHGWQITYSQRDDEGRPLLIELRRSAAAAEQDEKSGAAASDIEATMEIVRWLKPS